MSQTTEAPTDAYDDDGGDEETGGDYGDEYTDETDAYQSAAKK